MILIGFLSAAAAILVIMSVVARSTHAATLPQGEVQPRGYALRRGWLWALVAAVVAALALSIPSFPYPRGATPGVHIPVVAVQYGFIMAQTIPLNTPVIFDVTSRDVNHGFGIYDPSGRLIAQVQAMPDYVNHLPLRFTVPGHYTVRCLEYCGLGHAFMQGGFEVK